MDAARAKEVLAGAAQRDVVGEIIAELVEEGDRPRSIGRGVDVELHLAKGEQRIGHMEVQPLKASVHGLDAGLARGRKRQVFQIGRANVGTPVTNAQNVCRLLLEKKKA